MSTVNARMQSCRQVRYNSTPRRGVKLTPRNRLLCLLLATTCFFACNTFVRFRLIGWAKVYISPTPSAHSEVRCTNIQIDAHAIEPLHVLFQQDRKLSVTFPLLDGLGDSCLVVNNRQHLHVTQESTFIFSSDESTEYIDKILTLPRGEYKDRTVFVSGVRPYVRGGTSLTITALQGDISSRGSSIGDLPECPKTDFIELVPSACPRQFISAGKRQPLILDEALPHATHLVAHTSNLSHFNGAQLIGRGRYAYRPTNPTFFGDSMLIRYTNAHQCTRVKERIRSSFIVKSSSTFEYCRLERAINAPKVNRRCYQGLEDPRSFNDTHFIASMQLGKLCVSHQVLVTTGSIIVMNSPRRDHPINEKNWVHFDADVLMYEFMDKQMTTTTIRCQYAACFIQRQVQWDFVEDHAFPVHELRSGSNWLVYPGTEHTKFAVVHRMTIEDGNYLYQSHYVWWDTLNGQLNISGPVWHTRPTYPPQKKGLVEFVSSIRFLTASTIDVAYGSGDCCAFVSSVDIVKFKQHVDRSNYFAAKLAGSEVDPSLHRIKVAYSEGLTVDIKV